MQDAFNLAWKLAHVVKGTAKRSLLDSYSPERSAVGDMVLRNAGRMTDAAITRNPLLQALRNTVVKMALSFPQLVHVMANTLSELNIAYPESPLSKAGRAGHLDARRLARPRAGAARRVRRLRRRRLGCRRRRRVPRGARSLAGPYFFFGAQP